jgi:hypothetical protein
MAASNSTTPQAGSASSALQGEPSSGLIPPAARPTTPAASSAQQQPQNRQLNPVEQAQLQAWTDYVQRKEAIDTTHYQAEVTAIGATANVNAQAGSGLQIAQVGASVPTALAAAPAPDSGANPPQVAQADGAPGGVGGGGFIPWALK